MKWLKIGDHFIQVSLIETIYITGDSIMIFGTGKDNLILRVDKDCCKDWETVLGKIHLLLEIK